MRRQLKFYLTILGLLISIASTAQADYCFIDVPDSIQTEARGINNSDIVVGQYKDATNRFSGFLYDYGKNTFTTYPIDVPAGNYTSPFGINDSGKIVGMYSESNGKAHGFTRDAAGKFTTIDIPDGVGSTWALGINNSDKIVGFYADATGDHGFLLDALGKFTPIDVPGSCDPTHKPCSDVFTHAWAINDDDVIVGFYGNDEGFHGFVRNPGGGLTYPIDVPDAAPYSETMPRYTEIFGINNSGSMVGTYSTAGAYHGFVRNPGGTFTTSDVPGAIWTEIFGINGSGRMVGWYDDSEYKIHGFVTGSCGIPPSETVSAPDTPSGQQTGDVGTSYSYTTGGSSSNLGHAVEYQFDWNGDGLDLSSWGSATQSKSWAVAGTYYVKVKARCATHTSIESSWSSVLTVTISGGETVSTPDIPSGQGKGDTGVSYTYVSGGSKSSLNHPVDYQFDWGDQTYSFGSASQSHTWTQEGIYPVRVRANCRTHPDIVSGWSGALSVDISSSEKISTPVVVGPAEGKAGAVLPFEASGASSNLGHKLGFFFDFGDGTGKFSSGKVAHIFYGEKEYSVRAMALCMTHKQIVSNWSSPLPVKIQGIGGEEFVQPPKLGLHVMFVKPNVQMDYSVNPYESSTGDELDYRFSFSDGVTSDWDGNYHPRSWGMEKNKTWVSVQIQAKCKKHEVYSNWSDVYWTFVSNELPNWGSSKSPRPSNDWELLSFFTWGPKATFWYQDALVNATATAIASDGLTLGNEAWAVGYDNENSRGVLLYYDGFSWEVLTLPDVSTDWDLKSVYFTSATEGWAVGQDYTNKRGVLLHYTNSSWQVVIPPNVSSDWSINALSFTSSTEGWAVGYDNENSRAVLLHYSNGSWGSVNPPDVSPNWEIENIQLISSTEGWAVGANFTQPKGVLLHYLNGIWSIVDPPDVSPFWELLGLHFTSSSEGWAVGYDYMDQKGVLLHYLNGSWTNVNPPDVSPDWDLKSVYFASPGQGWAVGYDSINQRGVMLNYSGDAWTTGSTPEVSSDWELTGIQLSPSGEVWAVGTDFENKQGILLKTELPSEEAVSPPMSLIGPSTGVPNTSYSFYTGGATSSLGHAMEYQYDWKGDGSDLSSWGSILQTKTWNNPGTYNVKTRGRCTEHTSIVSGWSEGLAVTITAPAQKPNLTPYQPAGWSDKIVVSKTTGTTTDSPPYTSKDNLYVSWAVTNSGQATISTSFYSDLYVDGAFKGQWYTDPPFGPGEYAYFTDYSIGTLGAGSHTLKLVTDSTGIIGESNEGDNLYEKVINVVKSTDGPDFTGQWGLVTQKCNGSGSSQKCKITGSLTVKNTGNRDVVATSFVDIYLEGDTGDSLIKRLTVAKMKKNASKVLKLSYTLPVGANAKGKYLRALIDADDTIDETDEGNNESFYYQIQ